MPTETTAVALEALWRVEFPRLVAVATRITQDPDLGEQVAQDSFVAALEQWPDEGMPDHPVAWLMAVAKRRAVDHVRREVTRTSKYRQIAEDPPMDHDELSVQGGQGHVEDDVLRLAFICCHPILSRDARVALTLRLLGGLSTDEIGSAQLVPTSTAGQRIARAKRRVAEVGISIESPTRDEQAERLSSVLEVIYLIFNEGYAASSGAAWIRPDLAGEALRLARMLAYIAPRAAEVHGLLALLEIQASRFHARQTSAGPVLLEDQDRMLWDRLLVRRGLQSLQLAIDLGGGPYTAQAEIAACHARAATFEETDWTEIARLYDLYSACGPTNPVVELNRGIARWKAHGTQPARPILEPLLQDPRMRGDHLLYASLAELDVADNRIDQAIDRLELAMTLAQNGADQLVLAAKLAKAKAQRLTQ